MKLVFSRSALPAWLLLIAGLLLTAAASLWVARDIDRDVAQRFAFTSDQVSLKIQERLDAYALILRGGAGLFATSARVDRRAWRQYVDTVRAGDSVPGVQGIGFSRLIPPAQLAAHVAGVRAEGFPDYRVWPEGKRSLYSSIIYLEPFRDRNLRAFGYDMYAEPVRRAAMERARDTGEAALSGKVTLVQETSTEVQAGALMYVPVYTPGMPAGTIDERRAALMGWAYSPYRMVDLMTGILRDWRGSDGKDIDLHIHDGLEPTPANLLFSSLGARELPHSQYQQRRTLDFNGTRWLLIFDRNPSAPGISHASAWLALAAGLVISGLLFALALSILHKRERATALAEQLTLDIRERDRQLGEAEARWKFALEGSGLGVWDWNLQTNAVAFTRLWKEMLGYQEQEIGNTLSEWESRVHPDDKPATLASVNAYLEGRIPTYTSEHRVRCKDGSYKWILDRGMVVERDAAGKPLRMIGTHADINPRKLDELKLKDLLAESSHLREALDKVSSYVYMKDPDSRYIYANQPTLELFGCSAEELAGSDDSRFFPPEAVRRLREIDLRVLAGESTREEIDIEHPVRGRRVYLEVKTPIYADPTHQSVWGLCGISTDITEQRLLQDALRQHQQELLEAQRIAQLGSWKLDTATNEVTWTEELYRMLGMDPGAPPPNYTLHSTLFTPESWQRLSTALAHTRDSGMPYELELEMVRRDGSRGWMLARGEAIRDASGAIVRLRGAALDITARKQAQLRSERLARLYAALSQCNAAILHCRDQDELFRRVCQVVVEQGGMKLAWIGQADEQSGRVVPVSMFGEGRDYVEGININFRDPVLGRGPTGTAIRDNQPVWFQDFMNDPRTAPWHERARQYGWGASAALPICRGGRPMAALTFYAPDTGAFDEEIRRLLLEMASQISFALEKFETERAAELSRVSLMESEQRFRSLVEQSVAGAYIAQDGKFVYANPRLHEILGYGPGDSLVGRNPLDLILPRDLPRIKEAQKDLYEGRVPIVNISFTALRLDGSTTEIGASVSRATYQQRPATIALIQDISDKKVAEDQIRRYTEQLERTFMQTVALTTTLSEMRDPYTAGHERRVAEIAVAIGRELGLDAQRLEGLKVGGYLHDIGKTTVPTEILAKPGRLNAAEFALIKEHPQSGYEVLKAVEFPWPVAQIALQHHERIDGSGYPQGLKGEDILLEARITAVADVVESMGSHRPYRPALGLDKALAEIEHGRGSIYDTAAADACLRLFREKGYTLPA